jgi:hypothetical protein
MQLTLINLFKKTVPGHIFRGKRRLVKQVKYKDILQAVNNFKLQERNIALLSKPYLTIVSLLYLNPLTKLEFIDYFF